MPKPSTTAYYTASYDFDAALRKLDTYAPQTVIAILDTYASTLESMHSAARDAIAHPPPLTARNV